MNPIQINEFLRVSDKDANQYVVEKRAAKPNEKTGEYGWSIVAHCGTFKGLKTSIERELTMHACEVAKNKTLAAWVKNPALETIMGLPEKTGK